MRSRQIIAGSESPDVATEIEVESLEICLLRVRQVDLTTQRHPPAEKDLLCINEAWHAAAQLLFYTRLWDMAWTSFFVRNSVRLICLVHSGCPILALGESTAHSLLDAFASHVGVMYPCVDMATVRGNPTHLYHLESSSGRDATSALRLIDVEIIKAVMTVGAAAKSSEPSTLVQTLEQSLLWTVESVCSHELMGIEDVIMSCLMVGLLPNLTVS
jgi:hypothetical protein